MVLTRAKRSLGAMQTIVQRGETGEAQEEYKQIGSLK